MDDNRPGLEKKKSPARIEWEISPEDIPQMYFGLNGEGIRSKEGSISLQSEEKLGDG